MNDKTLYEIDIHTHDDYLSKNNKLVEGAITIQHMGRYLGNSNNYNEGRYASIKALDIKSIDKSALKDAKIYRFPKLSLPRDKMELVNNKYGSKIIRDRDKADLAVVSDKYLGSLYTHTWNHISFESKDSFKNAILNKQFVSDDEITRLEEWFEGINDDDVFAVKRNYYYGHNTRCKTLLDWAKGLQDRTSTSHGSSGYTYYVPVDNCESFIWLYDNKDKLCLDGDLGNIATEDSVTLNEVTFQSIRDMISSSDEENKVVGLEMMANCNADTSHTFLALIFFFHSEEMRYVKNWNYVNFKSLRSRFDHYIMMPNFGNAWPYDEVVKKLVKDDSLTEFAVQVIAKEMFKSVLGRTFGIQESSGVFAIDPTVLVLKPEYKDKVIRHADLQLEDLPF